MKLIKFKKNSYMLKVSREEAVQIARSLLQQIENNDCNSSRDEFYPEGCDYFSISVEPKPLTLKGPKYGKSGGKFRWPQVLV